ncbi:MAG: DNA polymerase III subunit delta' [Desulfobacter sp.]|nr:DNA polymerase III subunit delta' [Desulfobacter sp.]WDP86527.1 MAG: DNA polymerase III subunit delta' [Desulfobacter sp.]
MQTFDHNPAPPGAIPPHGPGPASHTELNTIIQTGKIPNGLIFHGARGTGKIKAAIKFAKACNCSSGGTGPCNRCLSCKKIDTGMHPDLIFLGLNENKKAISISQIREMGRLISSKPNEASHRMVCIQDADLMNVQAQNGLLKVLEEPPENTFFILVATNTDPLLPTILSRCRKLRFSPMGVGQIQTILHSTHGIDAQTAHIISRTVGSDLNRALECAGCAGTDGLNWKLRREWIINGLLDLVRGNVHKKVEKGLALSQKISGDPKGIYDAMAFIRTVLRDLCIFRYSREQIVNLDFFDAFKDISQIHVYPTFLEWLTELYETEKRLESNSGQRLTLDRFFLKLSFYKGAAQV